MPAAPPSADPDTEPELPPRVVLASMAGVVAAMLMAALDSTIVGTAMPQVIADLQGFEHYTAVTTVYMLAATTCVPLAGKLSDLFGRKPFLLGGIAVFVVGSALCGAAATMTQLVAFRGLQGLGAGFAQAMAFTTIADLYPPARRGRVTGVMGAVFGLASVIGPAVGGFLTDGPGWRWCFYVNVPVGILAFALLLSVFPHVVPHRYGRPRIDWLGALTLVLAVVPLLLALSWGGRDYAWASPIIASLLATGLTMAAVFVFVERRAPEPILPPALFRHPVVRAAAGASTIVSFAMFGSLLFIPLFIQAVIGSSAAESGAVLTPMMFSIIAASMISGQAISRMGRYRALVVAGVAVTAAGLFLMSRMDAATSYATVLRNMMVVGIGLGVTMPVFTIAVQNAVDIGQVGIATSSIQFTRSMGGSIGAAIFGAVLSNRFGPALRASIPTEVAARVSPELLARFEDPQALMDPEIASQMAAAGPAAAQAAAPLLAAVKQALATSIGDVFLFGAILTAAGLLFAMRMVDIPLRTTNRRAPGAAPAGERGA